MREWADVPWAVRSGSLARRSVQGALCSEALSHMRMLHSFCCQTCPMSRRVQIGAFEDAIFSKRMRELRRQKERLHRQRAVSHVDVPCLHFCRLALAGSLSVTEPRHCGFETRN